MGFHDYIFSNFVNNDVKIIGHPEGESGLRFYTTCYDLGGFRLNSFIGITKHQQKKLYNAHVW